MQDPIDHPATGPRCIRRITRGARAMRDRAHCATGKQPVTATRTALLDQILTLEMQIAHAALPDQTSSMLEQQLTIQQVRGLLVLQQREGISSQEFARLLGVQPNVATGIIQRLVERELVQRDEDPTDRRVRRLSLAPAGQALLREMMMAGMAARHRLLDRLSDDRLTTLLAIVGELAVAIAAEGDEPDDPAGAPPRP